MTFVAAFRISTPEGRELLIALDEIEGVVDNGTDPPSAVVHLRSGELEWAVCRPGQSLEADFAEACRVTERMLPSDETGRRGRAAS